MLSCDGDSDHFSFDVFRSLCVCACVRACGGIGLGSVKAYVYEKGWWRKGQLPYQKKDHQLADYPLNLEYPF